VKGPNCGPFNGGFVEAENKSSKIKYIVYLGKGERNWIANLLA